MEGALQKMKTKLEDVVHYSMDVSGTLQSMNDLIGKRINIKWLEQVICICGKTSESFFRAGFCKSCFFNAPQASQSIFRPELCTAHLGIEERDLDWEKEFQLAKHYVYLANSSGIKVEVYDQKWLEENNFGGVLGVGKGSDRPPYFLVGKYNSKAKYQVSLIGKGVLFDTGGYSLKSPAGMETMKTDMSGAASAWGVINIIARTNQDIGLTVYTPIVENMVSGSAIRPGDVLKTRNGKTIEVMNTDAEGRLILADALTYSTEKKSDILVTFASLTGAARVAMGQDITPFFSTCDDFADLLKISGDKMFDPVWRLPFYKDYNKQWPFLKFHDLFHRVSS